jgi:hypothetical protein
MNRPKAFIVINLCISKAWGTHEVPVYPTEPSAKLAATAERVPIMRSQSGRAWIGSNEKQNEEAISESESS